MKKTKQFTYVRGNERWIMSITPKGLVTVVCNGEQREYDIVEPIINVWQENEYVYIHVGFDNVYQFKFEENFFLVGDIYKEGEFVDSFASHVFGEDL